MSQPPLRPLSYATPRTDTPAFASPTTWRTLLAACWLVLLIAAGVFAYSLLLSQLDDLVDVAMRLPYAPSSLLIGEALPCAVWAVCIGIIAAALLWHWPRSRLVWLALLPSLAGGWRFTVAVAGSSAPALSTLAPLGVAVLQAVCLVGGAWVGRPVARFITALLLPPPLAAELLPFWRN